MVIVLFDLYQAVTGVATGEARGQSATPDSKKKKKKKKNRGKSGKKRKNREEKVKNREGTFYPS